MLDNPDFEGAFDTAPYHHQNREISLIAVDACNHTTS
jgi:hypothetical protein